MAAGDALQDGIDRTRPGLFPLVDRCPIWRGREGYVGQRHKPNEAPVASSLSDSGFHLNWRISMEPD